MPFQECPSSVEKIDYLLKIKVKGIKVNDLYPEYLKLNSIRKIGSISAVSRVGVRAHFPEQRLVIEPIRKMEMTKNCLFL